VRLLHVHLDFTHCMSLTDRLTIHMSRSYEKIDRESLSDFFLFCLGSKERDRWIGSASVVNPSFIRLCDGEQRQWH